MHALHMLARDPGKLYRELLDAFTIVLESGTNPISMYY